MRTILIIVLGLFIAQNVYAQADSLIIKLENYGQMIVPSEDLAKEKSIKLNEAYQRFYTDFVKIDTSRMKSDKSYIICYNEALWDNQKNRSIKIKTNDDEYYFHKSNEQAMQSCKYRLEFNYSRKVIFVLNSFEDIEKISRIDLDSLFNQSIMDVKNDHRYVRQPIKVFYSSENSQIKKHPDNFSVKGPTDIIWLYPNAGMSIINSMIAPEWGANIEFELGKKDGAGYKFGINYTVMYLYNKNDIFDISSYGFLSLNYYLKEYKSLKHRLSVGYLVNKSGNDFNGKTWIGSWCMNLNGIGLKLGGFYTKNMENKYVVLPSIGLDFVF